jgi:hypothetical protein
MKIFTHDKCKKYGKSSETFEHTTGGLHHTNTSALLKDNNNTAKPVHQQQAKDTKHLSSDVSYYT